LLRAELLGDAPALLEYLLRCGRHLGTLVFLVTNGRLVENCRSLVTILDQFAFIGGSYGWQEVVVTAAFVIGRVYGLVQDHKIALAHRVFLLLPG